MTARTLIVVPTYNERANIAELVEAQSTCCGCVVRAIRS